jgi:hypothetical protein
VDDSAARLRRCWRCFCPRMINRVDNRLFILVGFLLTAASLWQMTGFSTWIRGRSSSPGLPGFRARLHLCPLNLLALSGLPPHPDPGTALRADAHARRQHRHRHPQPSSPRTPRSFIPV